MQSEPLIYFSQSSSSSLQAQSPEAIASNTLIQLRQKLELALTLKRKREHASNDPLVKAQIAFTKSQDSLRQNSSSSCSIVHDKLAGAIPVLVELCAGSAILSFMTTEEGIRAVAIDHSRNVHFPKVPIIRLDLACIDDCNIIRDLIESGHVEVLFAAVPCGTASRAREIPLKEGRKGPPPLRSQAFPLGLPGLQGRDLERVSKANSIYINVADLFFLQLSKQGLIVVENPRGSWLWEIPQYKTLLDKNCFDVDFQHCKWTPESSMRPKWTRLRTNVAELRDMQGPCTLSHFHLPWGQLSDGTFATAGEAEYPPGMARVMASAFASAVTRRGYSLPATENLQIQNADAHKLRRATGGKQPRGFKLPPIVSEFATVVVVSTPCANDKKYKILRPYFEGGVKMDTENVVVGLFRSPTEFLQEAMRANHPIDSLNALPEVLLRQLVTLLNNSPAAAVKRQIESVKELTKLTHDLRVDDEKIIQGMDIRAQKVMKGKRLASLRALAQKHSYKDVSLIDEITAGFNLTGIQPYSGVFAHLPNLPSITTASLRQSSALNNQALHARVKSSGCAKVDTELAQLVDEEKDKGWLYGPFRGIELEQHLGEVPHLARRFPLVQGDKIRQIDDLSENNTNAASGCNDKLTLHDTDTLTTLIRLLERILKGEVTEIPLLSGIILPIKIHEAWKKDHLVLNWKGCTIDLRFAYKQLHVNTKQRWASCITVFNPVDGLPDDYEQVTLPFGSSASVLAFNRTSRLLWELGCSELGILWTNFFDDYPCLSPASVCKSSRAAIGMFLTLLGWQFAEVGPKAPDFAELFDALGVRYDIRCIGQGLSTVGNKTERIAKVRAALKEAIQTESMVKPTADSLRGKLNFMEGQVFGRVGRSALGVFNADSNGHVQLSPMKIATLEWICSWLDNSVPRAISPTHVGPPLLLFTDGAVEFSGAKVVTTCGAVLYDPRDATYHCFGCLVDERIAASWRTDTKKQIITEAEIYPILLAKRLWASRLCRVKALVFVDNEPAKHALVRGTSPVSTCADLVHAIHCEECKNQTFSWFTRVPTYSNLADDPSRLIFDSMKSLGAKIYDAIQPDSIQSGSWF